MQRLTLVRYTCKPDRAAENEALVHAVFKELRAAAPDKISYMVFRKGPEFAHLFLNLQGEDSAALTELPAFKAHTRDVAERCEVPPEQIRLSVELVEGYSALGIE
jgi:hypothetical protein